MAAAIINVLLPGGGLLLRDHLASGCALLLLALAALTTLIAAGLLAAPEFASSIRLAAAGSYVVAAAVAGILWWAWERSTPVAATELARVHAQACQAWLRGEDKAAELAALALCRQARHHAPSWDLLALVGSPEQRERAQRQASRLRRR